MPTKADLENKINDLKHDIRRLERILNQARLEIADLPSIAFLPPQLAPHLDPKSRGAINRARQELDSVVIDPCERINTYIKSMEGIGWTWESDYIKNGQFAWCGAFAAFCYTTVSFPIRQKIFPSCYRMYKAWSQSSRRIEPAKVSPGDIVVVFTSKRSMQGDHIALCIDASTVGEGYITTIEGNAHGELGNGDQGEGVITRQRTLNEFAHVYRLLSSDFDE
jgi:hypothetical protein